MRIDHVELEVLHARARRERAVVVYELLIAPLARLFAGIRGRSHVHAA